MIRNNMKSIYILLSIVLVLSGCLKHKYPQPDANEPIDPNESEVITTMKIYIRDSVTMTNIPGSPFQFKDPDGDGGAVGSYLPNSSDSLITLDPNKKYFAEIILLDETKNPVDSISNSVQSESKDHFFFYNYSDCVFDNSTIPYTSTQNGSNIKIIYADVDNGTPQRCLGQKIWIQTHAGGSGIQYPLKVTLRHQPGVKDGSYAPGETDVEVRFKVKVN